MMQYFAIIVILLMLSCNSSKKATGDKIAGNNIQTDRVEWTRPRIIQKSTLVYPDSLRDSNISGTVWMECTIDTLGNIMTEKVIESTDSRLDKFALQTVSGYTFSPGLINKKKIESKLTFSIEFK
jgi:TonB family protein